MTIHLGIDPGVHGGCVAIDDNGKPIAALPMPVIGRAKAWRLDARALNEWLNDLLGERMACLEQPIPMPGLPSTSTMATGILYGGLLAIFELRAIPLIEIRPQVWQGRIEGLPSRPDTKAIGDQIKAIGKPKTEASAFQLKELKRAKQKVLDGHRRNLKATIGVKAMQAAPNLRSMGNGKMPDWLSDAFFIARYGREKALGMAMA